MEPKVAAPQEKSQDVQVLEMTLNEIVRQRNEALNQNAALSVQIKFLQQQIATLSKLSSKDVVPLKTVSQKDVEVPEEKVKES